MIRPRGTTLVELLVGMLLAALATAGALTALARGQVAWRDADRVERLHERAQYVFGTLEPEVQMAGYFGADAQPQVDPLPAAAIIAHCGSNTVLPLRPAVRVLQGSWRLACNPQGQGAMPGSDVLLLRRASTRITSPQGALQLRDASPSSGGRDLIVRIFYVAHASDGDPRTPALRVKSLTAVAGEPAFIDTEVMPGVEDLQVDLLPDSVAPRSVRIRLRVRPDAADVRPGESIPAIAIDRRFNLRNAAS